MVSSVRVSTTISQAAKSSLYPYICASCLSRTQLASRPRGPQQIRRNSDLPFTEKLRRKIWGTDNPPGLKDPYGGPSFLERRLAERNQQRAEAQEAQPFDTIEDVPETAPSTLTSQRKPSQRSSRSEGKQTPPPPPYKEAETSYGLKWIGHRGSYKDMDERRNDHYTPWIKWSDNKPSEAEIWQALHESIFDATHPAEEPYDSEFHFSVTENGDIASDIHVELASESTPMQSFANARINFATPETFKILKSFQFLTSARLADPFLNALAHRRPHPTWADFTKELLELQEINADAKVIDHLVANRDLSALPNVKVLSHQKVGLVNKERAIGRLKIIEKELETRGLPPIEGLR